MTYPVHLLLYGFLLTGVIGLAAGWIDRKVTARVQYRVGPPLLQPLWDLLKLAGKETVIPSGAAPAVFLGAPLVGLAGVAVVSTILWGQVFAPATGFVGDWIVILYLLLIPPISVIVGGFASRNPLASVGAAREIQLLLGYELPFVLVALIPVIKSGGSLKLTEIAASQADSVVAASVSGLLGLVVAVVCIQAKLSLVPFDMAEAETEISGGTLIEYSGPPLAVYRLTRHMLVFVLPFLLILLFWGGVQPTWGGILSGGAKYLLLLTAIIVIRNTNPRLRTDQALRFFWGPVLLASLAAVALAFLGY